MTWTTWVTLMGFLGLVVLALVTGPAARRVGGDTGVAVTVRLCRIAAVLGLLAVPAVLTNLAHGASQSGGYDYGAAWASLYDGSNAGRLSGLEVTLSFLGAVAVALLAVRKPAAGAARPWLLWAGTVAGALALGTTKFPATVPADWGRSSFETLVWMLHLFGGAIWLGGTVGLFALALPGAIAREVRGAFWSAAIRRFSATAMSCVAAIALSGLFLYWEHVDGPSQLFTTMYGRVLGVKIVIFGTVLLLGLVNQFWLHPRIEALRAAGDERPLLVILAREFRVVMAAEVLLGLAVLMVAPFLHGSARNQAFQAEATQHATSATEQLPRIPAKQVSASTWVYGSVETVVVIGFMVAGYRVSGRIVRKRVDGRVEPAAIPDPVA